MGAGFMRGLIGGLGSGLLGWGFDTNKLYLIGFGMICFFGSYLIPLQTKKPADR